MAKLWQFSEGHPKPAFSEKKQTGDQEKLLKNRPKSTPRFKGPRALWRKCHYPVICIRLYSKDWRTFWRTSSHRLKGLKALWRKWHYPLSML